MSDDAAAILAKAADIVEQGWCQHRLFHAYKGNTTYCAFGAISTAAVGYPSVNGLVGQESGRRAVAAFLEEIGYPLECESIAQWNDTPGRTAEEVAATLRNAKRHL